MDQPMTTSDNTDQIRKTVKSHWVIAGALFSMVLVSIGISFIPFATWAHVTIGLLISGAMAGLVLWFFMHLNHGAKLVYQVMVFSLFFFIVLIALTLLAFFDPAGYHITH
jgi:caa(3)-type oxidase subunit IV